MLKKEIEQIQKQVKDESQLNEIILKPKIPRIKEGEEMGNRKSDPQTKKPKIQPAPHGNSNVKCSKCATNKRMPNRKTHIAKSK